MGKSKDLIVVAMVTFCLTATLFMIGLTRSSQPYDPWADVSGPTPGVPDGVINMRDIAYEVSHFNANGTPINRTNIMSVEYDSGWINITDKAGQNIVFSHGLGMLDWNNETTVVDITGKTLPDGELLRHVGLTRLQAWNNTYGGPNLDVARALVQSVDGGFVFAGYTHSFGAGGYDAWLVKTDAEGTMQWNKTYGGAGQDEAFALIRTSDGGYAFAGYAHLPNANSTDAWLVKTDANGLVQWNNTYGDANGFNVYGLVQTVDGGYALAGTTTSNAGDAWLAKTDANGTMQWNNTYGGAGEDLANALVQTTDGGYALAGPTTSFGAGSVDFWLVKTDANGNMQWNNTYGGAGDDFPFALVQAVGGGYALAGHTTTFGAGGEDVWLVKTDANGTMQWNNTYGGTYSEEARALVQTSDGGYALGASTNMYTGSYDDFWLVKTDANGTMQWNKTYGGAGGDDTLALVQTVDGGYALAGYTTSNGGDAFLVKTNADGQSLNGEYGLVWLDSPADNVTLYRGKQDILWNYVRIRILKVKQ